MYKKLLSWGLIVMLIGFSLAGCGPAPPQTSPEDDPAAAGETDTESQSVAQGTENQDMEADSTNAQTGSEASMNALSQAMAYSGLDTSPFDSEKEAKAFVSGMSLNDQLSQSLFYFSETQRNVFSDKGYVEARSQTVKEIIAEGTQLQEDTEVLLETVDALQAQLLDVVNAHDVQALTPYFSDMYAVHGAYMTEVIDSQLSIESLNKTYDDSYMTSWYQELKVNAQVLYSVNTVDYLNQLLVDAILLQQYLEETESSQDLSGLELALSQVDENVAQYEAVINGKRSILSKMASLEESDEYFALASAKAVMESSDAAKAMLKEAFPEDVLSEADKALIDKQVDFYVASSEAFYNHILETSEFALEIPDAHMDSDDSQFTTRLFGIAYADATSEAVQLVNKAQETVRKTESKAFSLVGPLVSIVKKTVVGAVDVTTDIVSKSADVVYGTAKGIVSTLKYTVGIDDSKAYKQQLKSIKKIVTGSPGAAAKALIKASEDLRAGIETKLGKALEYIPMGDVAEGAMKTVLNGYAGLVKSVASAFDGDKPGIEKVMSIIEASGLYNADILTNAGEMLQSAGAEKLRSIIPESMTQLYDAMTDIASNVKSEVQAYKQELIDEMMNSEVGQKAQAVVHEVETTAKEIKNVPEQLKSTFKETIQAEASGPRKVTEAVESQIQNTPQDEGEAKRWPFLTNEMQVLLMGFEDDLRARALKEVAEDIEKIQNQGVYKGYMMKVHHGGGTQSIGMSNSSLIFTFKEAGAEAQFTISGTGTIDSSGTITFESYKIEAGNVVMSTSSSFIGPISVDGKMTDATFTGTMGFSLESAPATITFHTSKVEVQ